MNDLKFSRVGPESLYLLEQIREAAFAPVFASFRAILGDEIYELAQQREDEDQARILAELAADNSAWILYAASEGQTVVGFISILLNKETRVGEIGLNAVHPNHAGRGIGTAMYQHAIERMKEAGMQVATVATGGDPSHAPARSAYRKAGFDVEIPSVWMCRRLP